jgi:hypothetical protein
MKEIAVFLMELTLLLGIEIGDYKHRRKLRKLEKQDGRNRSLEKVLFSPSLKYGCLAVIFLVVLMLIGSTYRVWAFNEQKTTQKEMNIITEASQKWKERNGHYPDSLSQLIANNPTKLNWLTDAWKNPYRYIHNPDNGQIELISSGKDGLFNTTDDIFRTIGEHENSQEVN